jgi:hypothetical protein
MPVRRPRRNVVSRLRGPTNRSMAALICSPLSFDQAAPVQQGLSFAKRQFVDPAHYRRVWSKPAGAWICGIEKRDIRRCRPAVSTIVRRDGGNLANLRPSADAADVHSKVA